MENALNRLENGVVVSCQALETEPLRDAYIMARMAVAAQSGGAVGIRANTVEDIRAIRAQVSLPIIGIIKMSYPDSEVYITPTRAEVDALVAVGADIIAMDATARARPGGQTLDALFPKLRKAYPSQLFMADCATYEDALHAQRLGFDCVGTTLRGYTPETAGTELPDFPFLTRLCKELRIPVIAEGGVWYPNQAVTALACGAHCCVVGTAITRPREITKRFADALSRRDAGAPRAWDGGGKRRIIAIDIGGTAIKHCYFDGTAPLESLRVQETPTEAHKGAEHLIHDTIPGIIGAYGACDRIAICTCGKIDSDSGRVIYATDTIPGYTGMHVRGFLEERFETPVIVENDTMAAAVGEANFGRMKDAEGYIYLTYGTGIGGAVYRKGFPTVAATGFGHIITHAEGETCTCGARGCYERYASTSALSRSIEQATGERLSGVEILRRRDEPSIQAVIARWLREVAYGLVSLIYALNPSVILLGGGIMQNEFVICSIRELVRQNTESAFHNVQILGSSLGNRAGVFGMICLSNRC